MKEMKVNSPSFVEAREAFARTPAYTATRERAGRPAAEWLDDVAAVVSRAEIARAVRNGRRGPDNGNTQRMRVYDDFG